MTTDEISHSLSGELDKLACACESEELTFQGFVDRLSGRSNALTTLFLALPFVPPLPMPGVSLVFGICISIAGIQTARTRPPWIPLRWREKKIPAKGLAKIFRAFLHVTVWFEKVSRPRGRAIMRHRWTTIITGVVIAICGGFIASPGPPATNFPAAIVIVIFSLALLQLDLLLFVLGWVALFGMLVLYYLIFTLGFEGVKALIR